MPHEARAWRAETAYRETTDGGSRRGEDASGRPATDERAYLYELIQTIGSGPDLDSIMRGVVRLVTEATDCHACFIYFMRERELELRVASRAYAHLESHVRIPLGEGLTGWVAKTRRSAFIREHALEDPRVRRAYFPELGDEVYQSLVSVPIFARSGELIGVITLHADAPHEFARTDLDFLEHTASLIAGAVDNARLYEEATARVQLLSDLSDLSQRIASAESGASLMGVVAEGTRRLLRAARCEIYLADPERRMHLAAAFPARPEPSPLRFPMTSGNSAGSRDGWEGWGELAGRIWPDRPAGTPLVRPLLVGDECLGAIAVLVQQTSEDVDTVLREIASHTAVAVKQHQVIESLREKNLLKDFFLALAHPERVGDELFEMAGRLGCDLDASHVALHIAAWSGPEARHRGSASRTRRDRTWTDVAGQVEGRLKARFSGLLVDRLERSIRALVSTGDPSEDEVVAGLREMDWGVPDGDIALSVGVSNPCTGAGTFPQGFEEAASAAEIGGLIRGAPGVTTYEELGPYRYILDPEEGVRDRYRERLGSVVVYDRRRGTQLLDTLETYLDLRGNAVATSRALFIHPNTLRQRLGRIEEVSGIQLDREDWLSLALATKVVKLQRMREAAREGGQR